MRNRKKRAAKAEKGRKMVENTPNHDSNSNNKETTADITKGNGNMAVSGKRKKEPNMKRDPGMANGISPLNGAAHKEEFYLINGHEIPPKTYMRVRQQSIVAAEQLSVDLAQNSHRYLRYGTYATLVIAFLLVFPYYFTIILRPNLPPVMGGHVAPGFEKVAEAFKYVHKSLLSQFVIKLLITLCDNH